MDIKIYYHHTDCGGVVYYAKYLEFLEDARTDFFREKGISYSEMVKQGTQFVVARQEIDYKAPAFYADTLSVVTRLDEASRVKLVFSYEMKNQNNELISLAKTIMVCVNTGFKPQAIPEDIRDKLIK